MSPPHPESPPVQTGSGPSRDAQLHMTAPPRNPGPVLVVRARSDLGAVCGAGFFLFALRTPDQTEPSERTKLTSVFDPLPAAGAPHLLFKARLHGNAPQSKTNRRRRRRPQRSCEFIEEPPPDPHASGLTSRAANRTGPPEPSAEGSDGPQNLQPKVLLHQSVEPTDELNVLQSS